MHTVLIENDFDAFALSDHRGWLHAVEELRLVYQCSPHSGFIEKLIADLEQCRTGATDARSTCTRARTLRRGIRCHAWLVFTPDGRCSSFPSSLRRHVDAYRTANGDGIREGSKPRCAHLLDYAEKIGIACPASPTEKPRYDQSICSDSQLQIRACRSPTKNTICVGRR